MDVAFGILLVIIFLLIVLRPVLTRWFAPMIQRWALGKMEDRMRRMAGMPTRKEEKRAQKQARKRQQGGAERFRRAAQGSRARRQGEHYGNRPNGTDLLQVVAEDVEFVEIKEFGTETEIGGPNKAESSGVRQESQVEDAEFTELK